MSLWQVFCFLCLLIQTAGTSASDGKDLPIFVDAEKPAQSLSKPELETGVKRLAGGLRQTLGIQNDDVVLAYTENSVSSPTAMTGGHPLILCLITPGMVPSYNPWGNLCRWDLHWCQSGVHGGW